MALFLTIASCLAADTAPGALAQGPGPAGADTEGTIVVVPGPFVNLSQQDEDDWIGAGIAETVSDAMVQAGATVIGWGGVAQARASMPIDNGTVEGLNNAKHHAG